MNDTPVRRLGLRVDLEAPGQPNNPVVTILIDGEDLLGSSLSHRLIGFDPDKILGASSPFLPTEPPRRVAVYQCSCGIAGCCVAAPIIRHVDNRITWNDFRDFTGVFVGPTTDGPLEGGARLPIGDLHFDAEQYRSEVERASKDRGWESPARHTARLVRDALRANETTLAGLGFRFNGASPHWQHDGHYVVTVTDLEGRAQVGVVLESSAASPEARAAEVVASLLRGPDHWNVIFRNVLADIYGSGDVSDE